MSDKQTTLDKITKPSREYIDRVEKERDKLLEEVRIARDSIAHLYDYIDELKNELGKRKRGK